MLLVWGELFLKVKNFKAVFVILFLVLALSISIITVDNVNAASNTLYVNGTSGDDNYDGTSPVPVDKHIGPMKNIQTALDSVADDGLIHVSEGKYMESLTINRNVELRGSGPIVTELNPANPEDNNIVINSAVTKAVISGFTIKRSYNAGIVNEGTGVTIKNNNIIDNGNGITALKNSETFITGNSIKGNGIGIFSYSENTILNFNRIYRNDVAIETTNVMDASYNWWGSNTAPKIENVKNSPWIYMTFNVNPNIILAGGTSQLTANFNNEYDGTTLSQFDPVSMGHLPDGLMVRFTTNLGNVGSKTIDIETNNGIATATLTADEGTGTATVSAKMDHEEQINCVGIEYLYVNVGTGDDLWSGTSPVFISGNTGPLKTIQTAINKINSGGTIKIAPGTYKESLAISKSLKLNGSGQDQTIIDGEQIRRIIYISGTPTVNINNLTLKNGSSGQGSAIYNEYGTVFLTHVSFTGNTANYDGGAIFNHEGSLSVTDSILMGNTANYDGGAICNYGGLSVVDGSFVGNTASSVGGAILNYGSAVTVLGTYFYNNIGNNAGGAIYNSGILSVVDGSFVVNIADRGGAILNYGGLSVSGSSFTDNTATYYGGGAILNYGTVTANFNRIVDNSITAIENIGGTVDARYNWWGSNNDPISKVVNTVVTPWLVLTGTANPTLIPKNSFSTITLNLLYDSGILTDPNNPNLYYHNPNDGHIPDGTLATFSTTLGNIIASSNFLNGVAQATLNGGIINGIADVSGTVDSETLHLLVTVDTIAPTAWANLKTGLYNVNKLVSLKMSEEDGTIYYTKNGANPSIYSAKYVGAILITATTTLKFFALDKAGNPSPIYTYKYTIDKIAPKVTYTYPKNLRTGQSRTATLYLKFSEKIKTSLYWSKIYVKNLKTGKKVSIRKWIKGNILYIKTKYKRPSLRWFRVYVPYKAVKDYAGNNLVKTFAYKFKTRR